MKTELIEYSELLADTTMEAEVAGRGTVEKPDDVLLLTCGETPVERS